MKLQALAVILVSSTLLSATAHADCYAEYSQGKWVNKCGEPPAPPAKYSAPTVESTLNQNDKLYLCSLVQLSEAQCSDVRFKLGHSALIGRAGVTQVGTDVRLFLQDKQCVTAVWKTYDIDSARWVLSSPTAVLGFPYDCNIPN